jgi:hypothetical protein
MTVCLYFEQETEYYVLENDSGDDVQKEEK